jgi:xanthine dehydrogenase accessory factor
MLVLSDGKINGTIGGGTVESEAIKDAQSLLNCQGTLLKTYNLSTDLEMHCGGRMTVYFETLVTAAHIIIFGAGHIGRALSKMATITGFKITVIDDRPGIFNSWTDECIEKIEAPYITAIQNLTFSDNTYIICCTYQHNFDADVVISCLTKPHKYLGMIGSKRKVDILRKRLSEEEGFSEEQINSIDMPMGIPIACETPEEIAVSILCKLVDVKNKKHEKD